MDIFWRPTTLIQNGNLEVKMVLKRRDSLNIFTELLGKLTVQTKITHLVRGMGLSHRYLMKYLDRMNKMGLIEVNDTNYSLSVKGRQVYELIGNYK